LNRSDLSLKDRLIRLIDSGGPVPVSTFMQLALHDPVHGYYATRPGPGADFATAPEISPLFGELIGLWLVHEWRALGSPASFHLVEIGAGRGLLMADALRLADVAGGADFIAARRLILIEPSPVMRAAQAARLEGYAPAFANQLGDVPEGAMLLVANEYLDCLPARQFRKVGTAWHECVVGRGADGALCFGLAADAARPAALPAPQAAVLEVQPALDLIIADLVARAALFRALLIDYGPADAAPGDTLRAFSQGRQVSPLADPGACDLTVDVDLGRFARLAAQAGFDVAGPAPQGLFLLGLGAQARLQQQVKALPDQADVIFAAAQRLIDPADMGGRFKAICLSSAGLEKPAGF
jgi:NADH dehydrogenase [ubiquinone] 1 alpha subcomplex assembly factor 7